MEVLGSITLLEYMYISLLAVTVIVLICYHVRILIKLGKAPSYEENPISGVSIVLMVGNEPELLRNNLPFFFNQKHPDYEVLVIINELDKDVSLVMKDFEQIYTNLRLISFDWSKNSTNYDKYVELLGIRLAKYDNIIFGDIGHSPDDLWVASMSKCFTEQKKNVIGYCRRSPNENGWIKYDNFMHTLKYTIAALNGKTYNADKKNFGLHRPTFYASNGVSEYYRSGTSNENYIITKTSNAGNVAVNLSIHGILQNKKAMNFLEWFVNRIKFYRLMKKYKFAVRYSYSLEKWLQTFYFIIIAVGLILTFPTISYLGNVPLVAIPVLVLIKKISLFFITNGTMKIYNEKVSFVQYLFYDIQALFIYPIITVAGWFGGK